VNRAVVSLPVFLAALAFLPREAAGALPEKVYTLRELLARASLIAVGKVEAGEGVSAKRVREGFLDLRAPLKGEAVGGRVPFRVDGPPLPVGALAIWVLAAPTEDGTYVVDHPQCAYDVTHLGIVKRAVVEPERVRPGYYLRREDERLAEEVCKARDLKLLGGLKPGPSPDGLKVDVRLASQSPRAGRGVVLDYILTNTSKRAILVCDSAEECYYVRAMRGQPPRVEIGRAGAAALDVEKTLGIDSLVSQHDFVELAPGASTRRRISVSGTVIPMLGLPGPVSITGIYRYSEPKIPLVDLPSAPWTGAVASAQVTVVLREALRKRR